VSAPRDRRRPGPLRRWEQRLTRPERRQELANSLSHGIMAVLALAALAPLIVLAATRGTVRHVVGFSVFGVSLVLLFSASALMHVRYMQGTARRLHEFLDYAGIYLLIAGSYTPFCLVTLRGAWGWSLFGVIWGLALFGTLCTLFLRERFDRFAAPLYLLMGWLSVLAIKPLSQGLQFGGTLLFFGGGLSYTVGLAVLALKRPFHYHAIWHLFVGLGALCHLLAMVFYVLPDLR
jgi:hemolysin III